MKLKNHVILSTVDGKHTHVVQNTESARWRFMSRVRGYHMTPAQIRHWLYLDK